MRRIIKEKQPFEQQFKTLDEALAELGKTQQSYKIEYAQELVDTGKAGDEGLHAIDSFVERIKKEISERVL